MFAIIKTGGKQYKVTANEIIKVEKLAGASGDAIEFTDILMMGQGDSVKIESCDVTSKWSKEQNKEFVNYVIFAFDNSQNNTARPNSSGGDGFMNIPEGAGEELPFN